MDELKEFKVVITETLQRVITIKAHDEKQAYNIIDNEYRSGNIVLNADDLIDSEMRVVK